jgi:hypothetical protein
LFINYSRLGGSANGLMAIFELSAALQLATEQSANPSGGAIDRRKQAGVAFVGNDPAERQDLSTDAAPAVRRAVRGDLYRDFTDPAAEPAKDKLQPPFDVQLESLGKMSVVDLRRNVHSVFPPSSPGE